MITVQTYGVAIKDAGESDPRRWAIPEVLRDELERAHRLRCDLVAIEDWYGAARQAVWSSYPAVAEAEEAIAAAVTAVETALETVREQRVRERTKRVTGVHVDMLRAAKATAKAARVRRREAIADVRAAATARITDLRGEYYARQKALYARHVQQGGLYWANFNLVLGQHRMAVQRVIGRRTQGLPASLTPRHFDGTGTVAVQLQRQAGQEARTPAVIADPNGRYHNVLHVSGWMPPEEYDALPRSEQRRQGRVQIRMRVGPGWVDATMQTGSMLPAAADITRATLTIRRRGPQLYAQLAVTATVPDPQPVTAGPTVALHLGWRDTETGIRVASWAATGPLAIPDDLRLLMGASPDHTSGRIILPARVVQRIEHRFRIQAARDIALTEVKTALLAWLADRSIRSAWDDQEQLTGVTVAAWRRPGRFVALGHVLAEDYPDEPITAQIRSWALRDRPQWAAQASGRPLRHRDDLYRQVAALVAGQACALVVDDTSIANLMRTRPVPDDVPDAAGPLAAAAARRRTTAAPGSLRAATVSACRREGIPVTIVSAAHLSMTHTCGCINEERTAPTILCAGCGAVYDPDTTAPLLMLQRAHEAPDEGMEAKGNTTRQRPPRAAHRGSQQPRRVSASSATRHPTSAG